MYTTKGTRHRQGIATHDGATRSSSGGYAATKSRPSKPERKREYSRDNNNTSWEYSYNARSSVSNRAPDPSMCINHTMEFCNLDNYITNMFG